MTDVTPAVATDGVPPRPRARRPVQSTAALALALACLAVGWLAASALAAAGSVAILGHDVGVVTVVNVTGAKFCMQPESGGGQRCGVAYERRDSPPLAVGEHVSISIARLSVTRGESSDIFVIEDRSGRGP